MPDLGDVLKAIGPNASIVFAAWIFMGFLQQRYDSAIDRYRSAVGDFRANDHDDDRAGNLKDQILTYRSRCKLMGRAIHRALAASRPTRAVADRSSRPQAQAMVAQVVRAQVKVGQAKVE